jgi:hypothetical protein
MGWIVQRQEQRRASRIVEGLPDRAFVHRAKRLVLDIEYKGSERSSKLSDAQYVWLRDRLESGRLATCIDHPDAFQRLLNALRGPYAHTDGLRICRELLDVVAAKGRRAA